MAGDPVLERVDALVAAGAPELALRLLQDSPAPPPVPGESRWEDHERRRLQIHRSLNDVDGIAARLAALPASASPALRRYALGLLAEAKIEAGDAEGAHRILQQVIE